MILVDTNEIKSSNFTNAGVPIAGYTNPSMKIIKKTKGTRLFKRRMIGSYEDFISGLITLYTNVSTNFFNAFAKGASVLRNNCFRHFRSIVSRSNIARHPK